MIHKCLSLPTYLRDHQFKMHRGILVNHSLAGTHRVHLYDTVKKYNCMFEYANTYANNYYHVPCNF